MITRNELKHMERFINSIDVSESGCWEWQGELIKGYGRYRIANTRIMAHRFSYIVYKGEIPEGLYIDHLCRNTKCVNPDHLEAVTSAENQRRSTWREAMNRMKGTRRTEHCPKGHSYADIDNVYTLKTGARACRTCAINRAKEQRKRNKIKV